MDTLGGGDSLAKVLGVGKGEPSLWKDGTGHPTPEVGQLILDLDHVVARALQVWTSDIVMTWLESPNAYLDHAAPIDVLRIGHSGEVLDALDASLGGAYA
jgi:uncharacterized protein (DUF2384 family)